MTNSVIPMPTRKTKLKMLNGLLDIYDNWKQQLDKLGQPYYLKLWLFEPRFSQSQVVCAIDDRIDYYETNFFQPDKNKSFKPENFGQIKDRLKKYNWNYALDEDNYANSDVGEPEDYASRQDYTDSIKWFKKLLNNPHRTTNLKEPIGETTEVYSFRRGDLWIGC
jgi:hypothetical protein